MVIDVVIKVYVHFVRRPTCYGKIKYVFFLTFSLALLIVNTFLPATLIFLESAKLWFPLEKGKIWDYDFQENRNDVLTWLPKCHVINPKHFGILTIIIAIKVDPKKIDFIPLQTLVLTILRSIRPTVKLFNNLY